MNNQKVKTDLINALQDKNYNVVVENGTIMILFPQNDNDIMVYWNDIHRHIVAYGYTGSWGVRKDKRINDNIER